MADSTTGKRKVDPRRYSSEVVDGLKQAPSRAMLRAVGYKDADFKKPAIGIASTWSNLTPCNMHIDKLAQAAAQAVDKAGGKSTTFGTITVSDGISNGAPGMRYSLVSREVIADSIETVAGAQGFDGVVAIGGCDKNMPGCMMALARLNRPAVFVYGGTIKPGPKHRDVISVFEAVGAHAAGKISERELKEIERTAIPGPGSCGGMYTANTMASAIEALGMSLPNSSAQEAVSRHKMQDCRSAGKAVVKLVKAGITPSQILTREAFENAITVAIALGGSTNAVLHLLAMAHAARVSSSSMISRASASVSGARRSAPERQIHDVGAHPDRRHPAADENAARRRPAAWRLPDRDRQDARAESEACEAVPEESGHRPGLHESDQARQPPGRALRQPRAGRRRRQNHRQGRPALHRPRARVRRRGGGAAGDPRRQGRRRAMSSSFATKARRAVRACARC